MKKAKLFDLKKFPMDMARLVCTPLLLIYRMRRLTPEGERYRQVFRGGGILAANHTAFEDPFLVGVAFWYRRLFFLAAEAVMQGKLRILLLKGAGVIEINRQIADIEAIQKAVSILKNGHLLCVFPQGGITEGQDVQAIKSGCVLMAIRADVPIVPMHILPKGRWYQRRTVVIGRTVYPKEHFTKKIPSTADIDRVAELVMEEMNRCAALAHRKEQV